MAWAKIKMYDETGPTYWVSGIYKVVSYDGIHFHAYYIPDHYKNWGDNPSKPPRTEQGYPNPFWPTLEAAQDCCEAHSMTYIPAPKTVRRAGELLAEFMADCVTV